MGNRILKATLSRHWFIEILKERKKIEFRDITPFWISRLEGRDYDFIQFDNGYGSSVPSMLVEFIGCSREKATDPRSMKYKEMFLIILGDIFNTRNCKQFFNSEEPVPPFVRSGSL